jgi:Uma2 family endonuclease
MSTVTQYMTEEDLLRMPEDGNRYELIEGQLRQMSPAGFDQGRCTGNLHRIISSHVAAKKMGYVLAAETGFIIARTPDGRPTVRAADIAFVASGRVPAGADTNKYLELAPDLVVETLSPSDTALEVEEKIASWLRSGVRVALTVNPSSRTITLYRSLNQITILTDKAELDLSDVIEGFRCRVAEIFD